MTERRSNERDWEGDWVGSCRLCWHTRNLGLEYRPKASDALMTCGRIGPDGKPCPGRLLISLTPAADKRVRAGRRLKAAKEYRR